MRNLNEILPGEKIKVLWGFKLRNAVVLRNDTENKKIIARINLGWFHKIETGLNYSDHNLDYIR